ncbi:hypothetical protein SRO_4492 [Streptomyces rochei]|nr:hypothetical protein SRO_4492 [Streptomyces rochei]
MSALLGTDGDGRGRTPRPDPRGRSSQGAAEEAGPLPHPAYHLAESGYATRAASDAVQNVKL